MTPIIVAGYTGRLTSAFLALIFAFATSAWSTASRALYLLLTAENRPWRVVPAAIPLALAALCPSHRRGIPNKTVRAVEPC